MNWRHIRTAFFTSLWFTVLTFVLMIVQVNSLTGVIVWRWGRLLLVGLGSFVLAVLWHWFFDVQSREGSSGSFATWMARFRRRSGRLLEATRSTLTGKRQNRNIVLLVLLILVSLYPLLGLYQTRIMTTAFVFVLLGISLNVVVGLGGMLNLGCAAFFAIGAYSYALLNYHYDIGFWVGLPIAAAISFVAGILVALPVIRLRGDYLAIVTLAFGEIVRIVLENWGSFTFGPGGISNIDRPALFGITMGLKDVTTYIYYIALAVVLLAIFITRRMDHSRHGRSWEATREDALASQAMGINLSRTKILIFAIGSMWAGVAGVLLAVNTGYINPKSFTLWQSIIPLCIIVLGGMGTISGVLIGALVLVLLPEYLRFFTDYRYVVFGAILVAMMIFRPEGIIRKNRRSHSIGHYDS